MTAAGEAAASLDTPKAAAVIVLGSLLFLILVRSGLRGVIPKIGG